MLHADWQIIKQLKWYWFFIFICVKPKIKNLKNFKSVNETEYHKYLHNDNYLSLSNLVIHVNLKWSTSTNVLDNQFTFIGLFCLFLLNRHIGKLFFVFDSFRWSSDPKLNPVAIHSKPTKTQWLTIWSILLECLQKIIQNTI